MTNRARIAVFLAIVVISIVAALAYAFRVKQQSAASALLASGVVSDDVSLRSLRANPHVLLRSTRLGKGYGHLVAIGRDNPSGTRYETALQCDRLAMAGDAGVCLTVVRGISAKDTGYWAVIFDRNYQETRRLKLLGIPSRVRISPDGRLAGMTVFRSGDGYSTTSFSTTTSLVDTATGSTIADLESFETLMDGQPFKQSDFNFWGVTFARDSNTFYATLGTGGHHYLIRGDARARRATVIGDGVECPAISPDNTRVAFKKRLTIENRLIWRLAVRELSTGAERLVEGETRSIDDQAEWLDDGRILYSVQDDQPGRSGTSVWVADVTGARASLWADGAFSPSVVTTADSAGGERGQ